MEIKPIFTTNETIDQTQYYWFQNAFTEEELEWVSNLKELYPYEAASIVGATSFTTVNEIRQSKIRWIPIDDKSAWVYEKLKSFAIEANSTIWDFDLRSIIDSIQYTEYTEGGDHYDWHVDIGPGSINHRKISIVVQLSDPDDYEGGDFELYTGGSFKSLPKMKGCCVLFPSFLLHRITPVTKGIRKTLVLWIGGGNYK
jgi:PKHD-type hydroxylase